MGVVALAVTGSIAAYKAIEVARLLVKAGHRVLPLMTTSATRFVGPVTLSGICSEPVVVDMWDPTFPGEAHVAIADRADVIAIVPATADILARLAQGRADDLVSATVLSARGPVVVAPAMHPRMWNHPATAAQLRSSTRLGRVERVGPVSGLVASGDVGMGRMAEPAAIAQAIEASSFKQRPWRVRRDGISRAGASSSAPVRPMSRSIRCGSLEIVRAARWASRSPRGHMHVVRGQFSFPVRSRSPRPRGSNATTSRPPNEMRAVLGAVRTGADALVMAAAVADFRPSAVNTSKIKKGEGTPTPSIALTQNPDLIAEIASLRTGDASDPRRVRARDGGRRDGSRVCAEEARREEGRPRRGERRSRVTRS